mmetsp:Transcript_30129/g.64359  ORF Transcript_30129/g.64359 Transcript_30129/m.64359 type:complete len:206 (-) Transcript_30129:18-635(-)
MHSLLSSFRLASPPLITTLLSTMTFISVWKRKQATTGRCALSLLLLASPGRCAVSQSRCHPSMGAKLVRGVRTSWVKKVSISPLPLMCRGTGSHRYSGTSSAVCLDTWIRPAAPVLSMREATLIVSPNRHSRGFSIPITPDTQGPEWIPIRSWIGAPSSIRRNPFAVAIMALAMLRTFLTPMRSSSRRCSSVRPARLPVIPPTST